MICLMVPQACRSYLGVFLLGAGVILGSGCKTTQVPEIIIGPDYVPKNIYRASAQLPLGVRRVVVLPLTYNLRDTLSIHGHAILEPVLRQELTKTGKFELEFAAPEQIKLWTGKESWKGDEVFPPALLKEVKEKTGAEAILFNHLEPYSPYPPLVVGWKLKLVRLDSNQTIWSAEEVYDASMESVSNSARRYAKAHVKPNPVLEDTRSILIQPARFGQFTLSSLLNTLPDR